MGVGEPMCNVDNVIEMISQNLVSYIKNMKSSL